MSCRVHILKSVKVVGRERSRSQSACQNLEFYSYTKLLWKSVDFCQHCGQQEDGLHSRRERLAFRSQ